MTIARTDRRRSLAALDGPESPPACASARITAAVTQPNLPDQVAREPSHTAPPHARAPVRCPIAPPHHAAPDLLRHSISIANAGAAA